MAATKFSSLAIATPEALVYGVSPHPLTCGLGLTIGAGTVFPEVNFTLPPMNMTPETWPQVVAHYEEMGAQIVRRAVALHVPGIVLEFELLPPMTENPEWGAELTTILKKHLAGAHEKHGLKSALRVTPTDIRDQQKPPLMRTGEPWRKLKRSFELCAEAGADILSIESVGGKEVHDQALMYGDFPGIVFALGVLAPRDMSWLWGEIGAVCAAHPGVASGGDSACGFANTAMQLAHQKMLPEVLAAVVRAMSAVRSLAAYEQGAVGPSKDCAYEGPVIKAITGRPISMEGKSAACAHFSPIGNIAAAMCDLWSNESVQNVRLLSGNAPEVFTEVLAYDCRLMNTAAESGEALKMRDWLSASDEWLSPQAAVLSPAATLRIAQAIVGEQTPYRSVVAAGRAATDLLKEGAASGKLTLGRKEQQWLGRIDEALDSLPAEEAELIAEMEPQYGALYDKPSYGM
ncbi:MAG: methyltransferase MtaB domain-containing protein [Terracidiphilus sp.]|nr:methyltransferase MtaB domain-containing protein [Terracidiphilus sp.]